MVVHMSRYTLTYTNLKSSLGSGSGIRSLPLLGYSHTRLVQSRLLPWSNFLISNNFSLKSALSRLYLFV